MIALGLPPRRIVIEAGHPDGAKRAVLERVGLAVLYRAAVAAELAAGQLVVLALDDVPMLEQLFLIYRRRQELTPLVQSLIHFLRDEARKVAGRAVGR